MSSLRQMKDQISSVNATKKLTASMKVVAVSRLKKKHAAYLKTVPFADEMNRIVRRLVRAMLKRQEEQQEVIKWPKLLNGNGQDKRYLVVIIGSDEGLSGTAQLQIMLKAQRLVQYLISQKKEVQIHAYGSRGIEGIKRFFPDVPIMATKRQAKVGDLYTLAERIASLIMEAFHHDRFDSCLFVYNRFQSVVFQKAIIEQVIPNKTFLKENPWDFLSDHDPSEYASLKDKESKKMAIKKTSFLSAIGGVGVLSSLEGAIFKTNLSGGKREPYLYDYEPSDIGILTAILPLFLTAYIYRVLLESEVSDNAARLMAMDNATRNAEEMLAHLNQNYRRARQAHITTEIAEVSGGANNKEDQ